MSRRIRPVLDRFAVRIALTDSGCIEWLGATTGDGYAQIKLGPEQNRRLVYVHRWSYEYHKGPIAAGLEVDHLCRNRACVNPQHLEAVTPQINSSRRSAHRTQCVHGHPFSGNNLIVSGDGNRRYCRACRRNQAQSRKAA